MRNIKQIEVGPFGDKLFSAKKKIIWNSLSAKNVKDDFWDFLNIHSVAKHQKIEGDPLETLKFCEKVSQSRNNVHKEILVKCESRTRVLLLHKPQKNHD